MGPGETSTAFAATKSDRLGRWTLLPSFSTNGRQSIVICAESAVTASSIVAGPEYRGRGSADGSSCAVNTSEVLGMMATVARRSPRSHIRVFNNRLTGTTVLGGPSNVGAPLPTTRRLGCRGSRNRFQLGVHDAVDRRAVIGDKHAERATDGILDIARDWPVSSCQSGDRHGRKPLARPS